VWSRRFLIASALGGTVEGEQAMADQDKVAIIEALNLYGAALDAQQWDLFDRVFTKDVTADFGPAGAAWSGLENFKRSFAEFHSRLDSHQHTMMGHLVHVNGDKANAFSYGNWLLVREAAKGGPTWLGTGWYDDELVRNGAGWRIRRRVCRLMSWSGNPLVPVPDNEHKPDMKTTVLREHVEAGKVAYFLAITAK
jgi:ketosteroid isomerase-like protein